MRPSNDAQLRVPQLVDALLAHEHFAQVAARDPGAVPRFARTLREALDNDGIRGVSQTEFAAALRAGRLVRAPNTVVALDAAFAPPPGPQSRSAASGTSIDVLSETRQLDDLSDTTHDWVRCVRQSLVAIAVMNGPEALDRLIRATPRLAGKSAKLHDSIIADYADGSLTSDSLERLGELLHRARKAGHTLDVRQAGFEISRPQPRLRHLRPGESALVYGWAGPIQHVTAVTLEPGTTDRFILYDPLRGRPLRRNLSRTEVESMTRRATKFQHLRWKG